MAGAAGLTAAFPPPFPLLVLLGLVVALLGLFRASPRFRAWALGVDIRALVLVHATRFVGAYFLVLHARGELPWAFAVPGGWGDIAVAAAAIAVVTGAQRRGSAGWGTLFVWNVVGFVDITLVVATAARLGMTDPGSMRALTRLPLSLLPTFLVPIIIATHVVIFVRLLASRQAGYKENSDMGRFSA